MYRTKVYVPLYVRDYYERFGDIDRTVNAMIEYANTNGLWDTIENEGQEIRTDKDVGIRLLIDNPQYEEALEVAGRTSKRFSLRRLLLWGYNYEVPSELSLEAPTERPLYKELGLLYSDIGRLADRASRRGLPWASVLVDAMMQLEEYL